MDNVRLMNRMDTKYVLHIDELAGILNEASDLYRILSIKDKRIFRYNSLYLDTAELASFYQHHNGMRPRYKVRFREYEDTGSIFLEVKRKLASDRTRKSRIEADKIDTALSEKFKAYITERSNLDSSMLEPALWTIFQRITLVGKGNPERITIDVDITFRHKEAEKQLPFLVICEVKRDQSGGFTEFMKILKARHIYPNSNSKYCLGTVLLKSPRKFNNFKSNLLNLNKLENAYRSYISTD